MKFRKKANGTNESTHVIEFLCECKAICVYQQVCPTVLCQKLFVISAGETEEQGMFYSEISSSYLLVLLSQLQQRVIALLKERRLLTLLDLRVVVSY